MYNWSTQQKELEKDPRKYAIWKIEQMVNFGLDGQKINVDELKKYWSEIEIDPARRKFLEMIIND